jgi:hypothetical protein
MLQRESFQNRDLVRVIVGREMTILEYAQNLMVPKFFFHFNVLYALGRSHGVPLDLRDYLDRGRSSPFLLL